MLSGPALTVAHRLRRLRWKRTQRTRWTRSRTRTQDILWNSTVHRQHSLLHCCIGTLLTEDWDSCAPSCRRFKFRLGNFPERINNLYFAFVFMLRSVCSLFCHCCPVTSSLRAPVNGLSRAVNKAADVLLAYDYSTGRTAEDAEVASSMQEMYVS